MEAVRRRIDGDRMEGVPDEEIRARLDAKSPGVGGLFDRYRAFRIAAGELRGEGDLEERWRALRRLRARYGIEGMFVTEDAEIEATLARRAGREAPLTEAESATVRPLAAMRVEAALRATGTDDETMRAWRAATFGEAAAERLAEVDRRRADFARRLAELRAGGAMEELFTPEERPRVIALERLRVESSR